MPGSAFTDKQLSATRVARGRAMARGTMMHAHKLVQGLQLACVMTIAAFSPQAAGQLGLDCAGILRKQTVVLFPGPEVPWLGDVIQLMPTHSINITDGAVGLLPLSDPAAASCTQAITDITDTMVVFEDGNLTMHLDKLPRNLIHTQPRGQLIIKGKDGRNKTGITDLNFLQALQSVGGLSVYNMDGLTTFQGLGSLTNITGDLIVSENDHLVNLTGINNLKSIQGDLVMNSNMNLLTLDGLGNLRAIGGQILLKGNGFLMNVDALSSLKRVGTTARFPNNGNLQMRLPPAVIVGPNATASTEFQYDGDDDSDEGGLLVIYGGSAPPPLAVVLDACDTFMPPLSKFDLSAQRTEFHPASQPVPTNANGVVVGNILIFDDGQLNSLYPSMGNVRGVTGSVIVAGGKSIGLTPTNVSTGLIDLDGMHNIQAMGELGIVGVVQLKDLTGLTNLQNLTRNLVVLFSPSMTSLTGSNITLIGSEIWIEGNSNLTSVAGLESLIDVGWKLSIRDCLSLENLDGLRSLRRVKSGIVILDNYNLTSLAGLASLRSAGAVSLLWNKNLTDIIGLSRLTRLSGDLVLAGNPILSLAPLQNLRSTGLGLIISNTNVTDLTGLSSLETVGMGLSISANKQLRSLAGLSKLSQVGDDVSIRGNSQLNTLAPLESMLKTVGGGVYIEDNWSLSSLGKLPQNIKGIGGMVVVRRNGAISSSQISSLSSKSNCYSSVPDTVALLPGLKQAAFQVAYPTGVPRPVLVLPGNGTMGVPGGPYALQAGDEVTVVRPAVPVTAFG